VLPPKPPKKSEEEVRRVRRESVVVAAAAVREAKAAAAHQRSVESAAAAEAAVEEMLRCVDALDSLSKDIAETMTEIDGDRVARGQSPLSPTKPPRAARDEYDPGVAW
jgi:uncharacterized membrane protein YqiK